MNCEKNVERNIDDSQQKKSNLILRRCPRKFVSSNRQLLLPIKRGIGTNICRAKGSLLSFVYKFGWVAHQCY
jgi:hypothetical protein